MLRKLPGRPAERLPLGGHHDHRRAAGSLVNRQQMPSTRRSAHRPEPIANAAAANGAAPPRLREPPLPGPPSEKSQPRGLSERSPPVSLGIQYGPTFAGYA